MDNFPYTIHNSKRASNLSLKINSIGEVILTKPYYIPKFIALKFLKSHQSWLSEKLNSLKITQSNQNFIYYLGEKFEIQFIQAKFNYQFQNNILHLSGPSLTLAKSQLIKNLKNEARVKIKNSLSIFAPKMNLSYNQIRLKDQSSRWGSCSSKTNLNFNWRLIMAPSVVLDYVIIHELAHLKFMDHSHHFWTLVEKFNPDYRDHRRWLKRNGHLLQSF